MQGAKNWHLHEDDRRYYTRARQEIFLYCNNRETRHMLRPNLRLVSSLSGVALLLLLPTMSRACDPSAVLAFDILSRHLSQQAATEFYAVCVVARGTGSVGSCRDETAGPNKRGGSGTRVSPGTYQRFGGR